jgi:hypothetical protein
VIPLVSPGQECSSTIECPRDYACDLDDRVCRLSEFLPRDGGPCIGPSFIPCGEGAYCDESSGTPTCALQKSDGAACGLDDECLSFVCEAGICGRGPGFCDGGS